MICSWCRLDYSENSLYHICGDGTTFADRTLKSGVEFEREKARRLKIMNTRAISESKPEANWTKEDIRFLKAMKIGV